MLLGSGEQNRYHVWRDLGPLLSHTCDLHLAMKAQQTHLLWQGLGHGAAHPCSPAALGAPCRHYWTMQHAAYIASRIRRVSSDPVRMESIFS